MMFPKCSLVISITLLFILSNKLVKCNEKKVANRYQYKDLIYNNTVPKLSDILKLINKTMVVTDITVDTISKSKSNSNNNNNNNNNKIINHNSNINLISSFQRNCSRKRIPYSLRISDHCRVIRYDTYECSGFCKSMVVPRINSESMDRITKCCRIAEVEYNYTTVECLVKPRNLNNIDPKLFYDPKSKTPTIAQWVPYRKDESSLYEGYFVVRYPIAKRCVCKNM